MCENFQPSLQAWLSSSFHLLPPGEPGRGRTPHLFQATVSGVAERRLKKSVGRTDGEEAYLLPDRR